MGCHNVHLRCESTDIEYVLSQYNDQGQKLDAAHSCLREKCGHAAKASAQATLTEAQSGHAAKASAQATLTEA